MYIGMVPSLCRGDAVIRYTPQSKSSKMKTLFNHSKGKRLEGKLWIGFWSSQLEEPVTRRLVKGDDSPESLNLVRFHKQLFWLK